MPSASCCGTTSRLISVLLSLLILLAALLPIVGTTSSATAAEPTTKSRDQLARDRLEQLVEEAKKYPEAEYTIDSWTAMRLTAVRVQSLIHKRDADRATLDQAYNDLQRTIRALRKRRVPPDRSPRLALSASLVATGRDGPVNNVALMWATAEPAEQFELHRARSETGSFERIYAGTGRSFNDYALADGEYVYRLIAQIGGRKVRSNEARIATRSMPEGLREYSNQTENEKGLPGRPLKIGDTYYQFRQVRDGPAIKIVQHTSSDGQTWQEGPVVMDKTDHPELADCKLESGTIFHDPRSGRIVWWCHWELSGPHYWHGQALVASAVPGERFTVHHIYTPLGIHVRDMSVFIDDDKQGYLVAAGNVPQQGANATLYIFRLNETYTDAVEIVAKVAEERYREAPHIVKKDGYYYLFFSQAAGWYPSRGGYVSARSIEGPWTDVREIGNASTFSSQSGHIDLYPTEGGFNAVMMGNRWIRGEGTNGNVALPVQMADGFAFYDYAPILLHNDDGSTIIPLHHGRLLSQGRSGVATIEGRKDNPLEKAFDGDYETSFASYTRKWPFQITVDLERVCAVRNVQISWYLHKGSEAYYTYTLEGSANGWDWKVLADRTNTEDTRVSRTYGFTSDVFDEPTAARYVRLTVHNALLHNNPTNWYPPTIYEMKVFGDEPSSAAAGQ